MAEKNSVRGSILDKRHSFGDIYWNPFRALGGGALLGTLPEKPRISSALPTFTAFRRFPRTYSQGLQLFNLVIR